MGRHTLKTGAERTGTVWIRIAHKAGRILRSSRAYLRLGALRIWVCLHRAARTSVYAFVKGITALRALTRAWWTHIKPHMKALLDALSQTTRARRSHIPQTSPPSRAPRERNAATTERSRLSQLNGATKRFTHMLAKSVYGNGALIAKCCVCAFAVLLGFALLLVCVYVVIPSMLSQAARMVESDEAADLYLRTVRADVAAFRQPPAVRGVLFPRDCFASVLRENPDIVGRLHISALGLGCLVTQTKDNDYYLTMNYKRKPSSAGAVFLDYRCNAEQMPPRGHYILYGNEVKGGSLFGSLHSFLDESFFFENRVIRFDTLYEDHQWEIFSVYTAGHDEVLPVFPAGESWLDTLRGFQEKSQFETQVQLFADDALLTLCTVGGGRDGTRMVVHARLME